MFMIVQNVPAVLAQLWVILESSLLSLVIFDYFAPANYCGALINATVDIIFLSFFFGLSHKTYFLGLLENSDKASLLYIFNETCLKVCP